MSAATPPRVVLLNRFYWPDVAATAQMLTDLAEDLAALGWVVTVVTSDSAYEGEGDRLPATEARHGVRIYRIAGTAFGRHKLGGRILDYLSYMVGAFLRLMRLGPQDVVVGMSDPPFIIGVVLLAGKIRRWRSVYWVQDLFPQIAGELHVMKPGSLAYRLADGIGRLLNRHVDLVVALGPRMAERLVEAGGRPERVTFVHNWADTRAIRPVAPADNPFVARHQLEGKFVVLYSGNAGRPHRFDGVMAAARRLADDPDVVFLFIGGGKRTADLKLEASEHRLGNVRFLGYIPRDELAYSLSAASLSLVTEDPPMVGLLVPSKTYGILASGRPVVFMGDPRSDVAEVVRASESGFVLAPDDGDGLCEVIRQLRESPQTAASLGRKGRRHAEQSYDRRVATARWAGIVADRLVR